MKRLIMAVVMRVKPAPGGSNAGGCEPPTSPADVRARSRAAHPVTPPAFALRLGRRIERELHYNFTVGPPLHRRDDQDAPA
jgi:hypothetical protein